ncbi:nicotinamide/nicotinic acid mononucleotide adenylyltransferase 1 isoform X2 [Lingula anatina]|uniref:Nicotinamide-nucleotide adenylyltransferase n=1 Tax=Lingula anatina TaxID=7574 RepID=A0A1S3IYW3_LINAN|nr:nicotinamide/nicotinic acid mononucleotide adenylyltransferase 1 isoform X2 [Lingula anatina]|eukprot:XP_013403392.1 nicotinamide/nicotinic acid mononucleotide adenylyltransferase 1 isoform X2 [Lingula anatina]
MLIYEDNSNFQQGTCIFHVFMEAAILDNSRERCKQLSIIDVGKSHDTPDENYELKMATKTRVVLLACGSFNPITNMHLRMFEIAKDSLHKTGRFEVIEGIVSPVSDGYKKKDLEPAKHRCEMVRRSLKTSSWIRLDTWESDQDTWTETARILAHHKAQQDSIYNANELRPTRNSELPAKKKRKTNAGTTHVSCNMLHNQADGQGPVQVKLLCGGDLLESFAVPGLWKPADIEDIVRNYGLVCITREGSNPSRFIYENDVLSKFQYNIHIVTEWITNDISATKIRRALRRQESVKYLVQDAVIDYIMKNSLYGVEVADK